MKLRALRYQTKPPADPSLLILSTLQRAKYPLTLREILTVLLNANLKISEEETRREIRNLVREGYDIKEISSGKESLYVLVRYLPPTKTIYRPLGNLDFPILASADYHIGSIHFSSLAMRQLIKDTTEYSVKEVLVAGDIIQGRGVYRVELMDLAEPNIQNQIDQAAYWLSQIPARVHTIIGGHEEKIKGNIHVGLDCLKVVSKQTSNVQYYGTVAPFTVEKEYSLLMTHGSGGPSYARSYKAERLWDALYEKPNFLVLGHLHVLDVISKGKGHYIIQSGTLQRENAYLIWKGLTPQIGWIILLDFNGDKLEFVIREPRLP